MNDNDDKFPLNGPMDFVVVARIIRLSTNSMMTFQLPKHLGDPDTASDWIMTEFGGDFYPMSYHCMTAKDAKAILD
jgi:hypothetical protein